ncbi:MAG TPA: ribonuclease H-like domain-containing protein [Limnochordales bacterium]
MRNVRDEVAARRRRAIEEGLQCRRTSGSPARGRYEVWGASGRSHLVKLRFAWGAVHRCDCVDFETKGLGTCKHIEAALMALERELPPDQMRVLRERASRPGWLGAELGPGVVYFDLETQRLFQEVGGRHHLDRLGLAAAVTFSEADGGFREYLEKDALALIRRLRQAPLVVGFNLLRFDYEVLAGYSEEADELYGVPTLDLQFELERVLGFRPGLDGLARATLGAAKTAGGLQAVQWFREGRLQDVVAYCREDVELTRRLFLAGLSGQRLRVPDRRGQVVEVAAPWAGGLAAA